MIIYHFSSTYIVFTSFVSKNILSLHISHKYRLESNKHTKKHKNTSIDEKNKRWDEERRKGGRSILSYFCSRKIEKRRQRTPKTRKIDTELLLFNENCIILRKSYLLLLLLLMLFSLFYSACQWYRFWGIFVVTICIIVTYDYLSLFFYIHSLYFICI